MIISRISYRKAVHHSIQILVALTNRKVPKFKTCREYSVTCVNMQPNCQRTYQIVVAATREMGIGKNGKLPWNLPSDLKYFKEITTSTSDITKKNAVIMGRKTWDSIPLQFRPLPNRLNVVLTRSTTLNINTPKNVITCSSIPSALKLLATSPYCSEIDKVFVIGGGQILKEAMNGPFCEAIHMTEIDKNIDCDAFTPQVDISVFRPWCASLPITENDISYRFVSYVRVYDSSSGNALKVENFGFLPKIIFEKRDGFFS